MNFNFSRGQQQRQQYGEMGPDEEDYYKILEIKCDASNEEIKKAYRRLSMIHHPDKNESSEESNIKFKQLAAAYETLSDPDKRRMYDMGFSNGLGGLDFENMNINPFDIFNMIFGLSQQQQQQQQQHQSQQHDFGLPPGIASFIKMGGINPAQMSMPMQMQMPMQMPMHMQMPMQMPMQMHMPMGMGIHIINPESGFSFQYPQSTNNQYKCEIIEKHIYITLEDAYTGIENHVIEAEEKYNPNNKTKCRIKVCIPPGVNDKEVLIVSDPMSTYSIHVTVNIKQHELFKRNDMDLIIEKEISLKESLCGLEFTIKHLNNKTFHLQHKDGTIIKDGVSKTIQKLGMMNKNRDVVGNLVIIFKVAHSDKLSKEQIEKLYEIL